MLFQVRGGQPCALWCYTPDKHERSGSGSIYHKHLSVTWYPIVEFWPPQYAFAFKTEKENINRSLFFCFFEMLSAFEWRKDAAVINKPADDAFSTVYTREFSSAGNLIYRVYLIYVLLNLRVIGSTRRKSVVWQSGVVHYALLPIPNPRLHLSLRIPRKHKVSGMWSGGDIITQAMGSHLAPLRD